MLGYTVGGYSNGEPKSQAVFYIQYAGLCVGPAKAEQCSLLPFRNAASFNRSGQQISVWLLAYVSPKLNYDEKGESDLFVVFFILKLAPQRHNVLEQEDFGMEWDVIRMFEGAQGEVRQKETYFRQDAFS